MKKLSFFLIANSLIINFAFSQNGVSVNATGNPADISAMLDVSSINKGVLVPRMTETQKNAIVAPATGLLIYQTDNTIGFWYYDTSIPAWMQAIGPQGPAGATGADGTDGATGTNGTDGAVGATGADGSNGATGATGPIGCASTNYLMKSDGTAATCTVAPVFEDASGWVGIGNVTPTERVDISGNLKFSQALMPNNNPGTQGQILQSQGSNVPPLWVNVSSIAETYSYTTTALVTQAPPPGATIVYIALTGLSHAINVPAGHTYKVFLSAFGTCSKESSDNNRVFAQYEIYLDGIGTGDLQRVAIDDESGGYYDEVPWSITTVLTLNAGAHTITIMGAHCGATTPNIWLCTAAGYVGQAKMNLIIIKD